MSNSNYKTLDLLYRRLMQTCNRAASVGHYVLVIVSERGGGDDSLLVGAEGDILRSGVALLHAGLDDFLRGVQREFLPRSTAEDLKEIPLIGCRSTKFSLADLLPFQEKSVRALIDLSIASHFERSSFNSVAEIVDLLKRLRLDAVAIDPLKPDLSALMKRRHQIVHRADLAREDALEPTPWTKSESDEFIQWGISVLLLGCKIWRLMSGAEGAGDCEREEQRISQLRQRHPRKLH
jgi:hypothetical protein